MTETANAPGLPACTVIIPTRDQLDLLRPCVEAVLNATYNGELDLIIVDNNSKEAETQSWLRMISEDARVKVITWPEPFNYSRINNMAAEHAQGELLCFLNNDIEPVSTDWLQRLAMIAMEPEVGAVGALLLYPDNTVQHAGVMTDASCVALHVAQHQPVAEIEEQFLLDMVYPCDAVTAACMLTRKSVFQAQGGFDEQALAVAFNDVDYCLRLEQAGLLVLMHPQARLIHHESVSRKSDELPQNRDRARSEWKTMQQRWGERLRLGVSDGQPRWLSLQTPGVQRGLNADPSLISGAVRALRASISPAGIHGSHADWKQHYQAVAQENVQLHASLQELTSGRLWRLTSRIRDLLYPLLQFMRRITGRSPGSVRGAIGSSPAGAPLPDRKQAHQAQASQHFDDFMAANEKLDFSAREAPVISLVLVLYNQAPLTLLCLQSIIKHADIPLELIIVDNASSDATEQLLACITGAHIIRNPDNRGFVEAVNQGAEAASGEYLLLLNNDAMLHPRALSSALLTFKGADNIGAVGGKILLLDGLLQEAGSIIWRDGNCTGYGRGDDPNKPEYNFVRDVDYCSGAFLMTPLSTFRALGGFDMDFAPAYYEESDYCIRLARQGLRVVYQPNTVITHYEFASSAGQSDATALQQKHRQVLCNKHPAFLNGQADRADHNVLEARSSSNARRVLMIDDRVPHPSLGAGYPRSRELIHALNALPVQLTLYPLQTPEDDWRAVYETLPAEVEVMLDHGKASLARFLTERAGYYDSIVISRAINMTEFLQASKAIPGPGGKTRIIYDAEAVIAPREAMRLRLNGQQISAQREQVMVDAEIALANGADAVIAVSEAEAALYRNAGLTNTKVLGHTLRSAPLGGLDFLSRKDLLFVGALRHDESPNVDSLIWFVESILPLIRKELQQPIRLKVAGDHSAPALRHLSGKGLDILGRVPDLTSLYEQCRVFIAPTRFAAGIPHKVHEAAAHGIPTVCTPLLAQQLGWQHERELLSASDEQAFASQCIRLYTNETLWSDVRRAAHDAVSRDCSPDVFRQRLEELFDTQLPSQRQMP